MIFQRQQPKVVEQVDEIELEEVPQNQMQDEVETVVGPSVNVEGDFASEGNIVVKGTVSGSVFTSKHLTVERGAKINHLSYIGDAVVGAKANVGAGTITCNYDGVNKHRTIIEDDAFIGSDTQLVAPVTVGRGATLGAGTTLTKDAPADTLTVSRPKQLSLTGWQRPVKISK